MEKTKGASCHCHGWSHWALNFHTPKYLLISVNNQSREEKKEKYKGKIGKRHHSYNLFYGNNIFSTIDIGEYDNNDLAHLDVSHFFI